MHWAAFAEKARAKFFEDPVGADQDAPKTLDVLRVIGRVMPILIEGSLVVEFVRRTVDAYVDSGRVQARHVFGIEVGDGAGVEPDSFLLAFARSDRELVFDKVKLHFES